MQELLYTKEEERLNYITHAVATLLSVVGFLYLLDKTQGQANFSLYVSLVVYSISLILAFSSSAIYHWVEQPDYKYNLRLLDHYAIYLVIVGTYTPFTMAALPNSIGVPILIMVWTLVVIAMVFKFWLWQGKRLQKYQKLDLVIYILIGFSAILFINPLIDHLSLTCVLWIIAGGITFAIGGLFYLWKSLPYNHVIWHMLGIAAAVLHYYAVIQYVVPASSI